MQTNFKRIKHIWVAQRRSVSECHTQGPSLKHSIWIPTPFPSEAISLTHTNTHTQQQGQWPVSVKYKFSRVWWHRCILWDGLATEAAASQPLDKRTQGWPNSQRDKQTELVQIESNKSNKTNQIFFSINAWFGLIFYWLLKLKCYVFKPAWSSALVPNTCHDKAGKQ